MSSSQELNKIWSMMVFDEELLVKAEEEASKYFAKKKKQDISDRRSFSLGFTLEFNTPTPSPDASNSEDTEIINWRCKEYNNSSLPRFLEEFYCVEAGIMNTATIDKNLDAYQKDGTYIGMHPKLGEDGRHFDQKKAANRKWGKLIEDMLKIVFPTFDHKGLGFPSRYANVPKQPNTNDCGIYVIKFLEEWIEASELHAYNNEELLKIRRRLVLDITPSNYNTNRDELLLKASTITQRRNNPNRGKKKKSRHHIQLLVLRR
ncbi:hypothetical protein PIB30_087759 [Stylosanthes scabra]|uniref:Ubiquitin-like protease family profile domain-containing protein n=1 Tax=Stylosanthes scabra TaxID=79078 RepID=A0ABU6VSM3_9FABA|nr:hypothetical protein [Stylosanthes scabra]